MSSDVVPPRPEKKPSKDTKPLTVRLLPEVIAELEQIAKDEGYKRHEILVMFVLYALDAHKKTSVTKPKKTR